MRTGPIETNDEFATVHEVHTESAEPTQTEVHTESATESVYETNVDSKRWFMEMLYNNIYRAHARIVRLERELSEARAQRECAQTDAYLWLRIELRPIWQTLSSDSEFAASLDYFVEWAADNGYCPGFILQKINKSAPHSVRNSRWIDPNPKPLSYDSIGSIEEFCKSNNLPYTEMLYYNGQPHERGNPIDPRFGSVRWRQNNN